MDSRDSGVIASMLSVGCGASPERYTDMVSMKGRISRANIFILPGMA
jgi:hypothetical protein